MSHDERQVAPDHAAPAQDEALVPSPLSPDEQDVSAASEQDHAEPTTAPAGAAPEEASAAPVADAAAPEPATEETPASEEAAVSEQAPASAEMAAADEAPAPEGTTSEEADLPQETTEPEPAGDEAIAAQDATESPQTETPAPEAAETTETAPATAEAAPVTPATAPRPRPVPRPSARPTPTPAAVAPAVTAPSAPVPPALTPAETAEAARWGRVDDDGTVWVREATGERVVGQYPDADPTEALAFYVRRYADLHAKVVLFEARLAATDLAVKEIDSTLTHLGEELAEPAAVGDLAALRERLEALRSVAAERRAAAEAERAAARETALVERTAIVEAAEKIAGTDPERMQWRPAGEQLRTLLDRWKEAQRHGPRLDRGTEDALWKRFSHARSAFDRERRRWFSELEKRNAGAKAAKEALVAEAERLSSSTDWGATSAAYRDLMTRWKAAGRASRKDDDALWVRFRAAQDVFFAARDASQRQTDAEFSENLEVKLRLLEEAERLVPVTDLAAAKAALRDIQDRWERAGKVPRGDVQRVEGRLRAVEQAVRDADQAQWRRTNPETRARAEGAAAQLHAAIAGLEADLDAAKATGDARKVAEAQSALDARRAWLEQVERAAQEARG